MARRSEHTQEEIRQMVLHAAETIVIEEGAAALKVRNIAMEIGYTVGSIYMVFDNMADLTLHIKARTLDDIATQLQQVSGASAEQNLLALAKAYLNFAQTHYHRWQMLFEYHDNTDKALPTWYQEKVGQVFQVVEVQFQQLLPTASAEQTQRATRALWSGVHGICSLSLSGSLDVAGVSDVEATVMLLAHSFIRGWMAEVQAASAN